MTLGQRIQELRKGSGFSQEELGERMGVSRQAISKWEGDQTIPELDNLIALAKLFGLTVGQLLGVEQPVPAPAAPKTSQAQKVLLSGMGTLFLVLTIAVGMLWAQVQSLSRQAILDEEYVLVQRDLFQKAECQLSDLEFGFYQGKGTQDLTVSFTLQPVEQLKGWAVAGLTVRIEGKHPFDYLADGTALSESERMWSRTEYITLSTSQGVSRATLTLPEYGGESVWVTATLRATKTGRTIETAESVFLLSPVMEKLAVTGIETEVHPNPSAAVPKSVQRSLPDPRFES